MLRDRGSRGASNDRLCNRISKEKVRDVLRMMKTGKIVGLDVIFVEIWNCLGEEGLEWLTKLFNVILRMAKMLSE